MLSIVLYLSMQCHIYLPLWHLFSFLIGYCFIQVVIYKLEHIFSYHHYLAYITVYLVYIIVYVQLLLIIVFHLWFITVNKHFIINIMFVPFYHHAKSIYVDNVDILILIFLKDVRRNDFIQQRPLQIRLNRYLNIYWFLMKVYIYIYIYI